MKTRSLTAISSLNRTQTEHRSESQNDKNQTRHHHGNQGDRGGWALEKRLQPLEQEQEYPQDDGDEVATVASDVYKKVVHFSVPNRDSVKI